MNAQRADRDEILEVAARYFHGADAGDFDGVVRSCFHPDARFDYTFAFSGGLDDFLAYCRTHGPTYSKTFHLTGNALVDLDGDSAEVVLYVVGFCKCGPTHPLGEDAFVTMWMRYVDRFERRDAGWLIADRRVHLDMRRVETGVEFTVPPTAAGTPA